MRVGSSWKSGPVYSLLNERKLDSQENKFPQGVFSHITKRSEQWAEPLAPV